MHSSPFCATFLFLLEFDKLFKEKGDGRSETIVIIEIWGKVEMSLKTIRIMLYGNETVGQIFLLNLSV
jgi:hypothetical protein